MLLGKKIYLVADDVIGGKAVPVNDSFACLLSFKWLGKLCSLFHLMMLWSCW